MDFIDGDHDNFGGRAFHDEDGDWRLQIYVVDGSPARQRAQELIPSGAPVEWTVVKYSYATLERTRQELREIANGLGRQAFNYMRSDVRENRVIASLKPAEEPLARSLAEAYPPDLLEVLFE